MTTAAEVRDAASTVQVEALSDYVSALARDTEPDVVTVLVRMLDEQPQTWVSRRVVNLLLSVAWRDPDRLAAHAAEIEHRLRAWVEHDTDDACEHDGCSTRLLLEDANRELLRFLVWATSERAVAECIGVTFS